MKGTRPHRTLTGPMFVAFAVLAALLLVACEEPRASIRPSPSLIEIDFSPPPTPGPEVTDAPTIEPTFVAIPVGWDNSFCGVLADAVIAQELVIDIQRALDEEAVRDARGLARELRDITAEATTLLAALPAWDPAADATQRIAALIDLGARAGEQYGIAFTEESASALRRAHNLRRDMARATPAANEALAGLTDLGIVCEGTPMQLETF